MNNYLRAILIGIFCMLLSGCATAPQPLRIRSEVDGLTSVDASLQRRFVILPADTQVNAQDLQFLEFKGYVEKALAQRGFIKVEQMQAGDVVLFLRYGVGDPQMRQYSYDVPIWNDFGYAYYPYARRGRYYPAYGVAGYTQHIETYTVYRRYLTLEAYDMASHLQQQTPKQLWKVNVQSQGQSNDLRLVFPYLVTAMQPYLATNTGHMQTVDIDEANSLLRDIMLGNPYRLPATLSIPQP
jgi:hypothetical protein